MKSLEKVIQSASTSQRLWIDREQYVGPDRRRFSTGASWNQPDRREQETLRRSNNGR
jgi:hypothetical protein